MTRDQVEQELLYRLDSSLWNQVKDSLVGKELLRLGVEAVMYANEVNESISNAFDYTTADVKQLISVAHTYDIGLCFSRPSTVTVRTYGSDFYDKYTLKLVIGSVTYYNIEPCIAGRDITLYQGVHRTWMGPVPESISIDTESGTPIQGYKLGNVLPESIYVLDTYGNNVGRYSYMNYGSLAEKYFKCYNLSNGDLIIVKGDGVWGSSYGISNVECLAPTCDTVETASGRLYHDSTEITNFTLKSSTNGSTSDITFARDYFRKLYLERNAVVSVDQVRNYVNTYSDVLDSNVEALSGSSNIFVKPTDFLSSGLTFDDILMGLRLHGLLGISYSVAYGQPITFKFNAYNSEPLNRSKISTIVSEKYSYDSMKFMDRISLSEINNLIISEIPGTATSLHAVIESDVVNGKLAGKPIEGSVKIYDGDGVCIGVDSKSIILGYEDSSSGLPVFYRETRTFGKFYSYSTASGCNFTPIDGEYAYPMYLTCLGNYQNPKSFTYGDKVVFTGEISGTGNSVVMLFNGSGITLSNALSDRITPYLSYTMTGSLSNCRVIPTETSIRKFYVDLSNNLVYELYSTDGDMYFTRVIATNVSNMNDIVVEDNRIMILFTPSSGTNNLAIVNYIDSSVESYTVLRTSDADANGLSRSSAGVYMMSIPSGTSVTVKSFYTFSILNGVFTPLDAVVSSSQSVNNVYPAVLDGYMEFKTTSQETGWVRIEAMATEFTNSSSFTSMQYTDNIGSVDYNTGRISTKVDCSYSEYECSMIYELPSNKYLVLDSSNPVDFVI